MSRNNEGYTHLFVVRKMSFGRENLVRVSFVARSIELAHIVKYSRVHMYGILHKPLVVIVPTSLLPASFVFAGPVRCDENVQARSHFFSLLGYHGMKNLLVRVCFRCHIALRREMLQPSPKTTLIPLWAHAILGHNSVAAHALDTTPGLLT